MDLIIFVIVLGLINVARLNDLIELIGSIGLINLNKLINSLINQSNYINLNNHLR